jgi:broad specificity phosphatase PhoE
MAATTLLLIRHAEVGNGSEGGRLCGWLDLPVSREGRQHLERVRAQGTSIARPDVLYSSPLRRALQTASLLGHIWRLVVRFDAGLREIHCGALEGWPIERIIRRHPDLWQRNVDQHDDEFAWPEGESYRGFRARVLDTLGHIAARHPNARVAVVTHAGVITQVWNALEGWPAAVWNRHRGPPLAVTRVAWSRGPVSASDEGRL